MNAKAISFTPEVLKAKLRALEEYGTCQTRRPMKPQPPSLDLVRGMSGSTFSIFTDQHTSDRFRVAGPVWAVRNLMGTEPEWRPPFGVVGQRLWIRERARVVEFNGLGGWVRLRYTLDNVLSGMVAYPKRLQAPTIENCLPNGVHREGARHFLEVVEVRAERVAEISEQDAMLEGCAGGHDSIPGYQFSATPREHFRHVYDSIYGAGAHARDWCWVYTLKRATP